MKSRFLLLSLGGILIISFFLSCSSNNTSENLCGDEKDINFAIVSGETTPDDNVTKLTDSQIFTIGAVVEDIGYDNWMNICSGTLIYDNIVITAAHCVVNKTANEMGFWLGSDLSQTSGENFFHAQEIYNHPDYDSDAETPAADYDLGIMILEDSPLDRFGNDISPMPINIRPLPNSLYHSNVQIAGYGLTQYPDGYNDKRYWSVEKVGGIDTNFFLVEYIGRGYVCNGDSGGPALWTFPDETVRLAGVASLGTTGCEGPAEYTRIDSYMNWLKDYLPCGGLDSIGTCSENTAMWCDNGQVQEIDCYTVNSDYSYSCGPDTNNNYRCIDPCEGITFQGICDGNTAIWCDNGTLTTGDCETRSKICGLNGENNYRCIDENECNGLDYKGKCEDNIAYWCDSNELQHSDCESREKVCAQNSEGNYRCVDEDLCNGISYQGYCEDSTAIWCDMAQIQQTNCNSETETCGEDNDGNFRCIINDPCNGETAQGRCDGNNAIWCENNQIQNIDCTDSNQICGDSNGNNRCINNDSCNGLTYLGRCTEDNKVEWCDNGQIKTRDCPACNQVCGWINDTVGNYCISN